jgi:phosphoribosylformimino-5-aminoimidazole carboxamide ribotide isomerase
VIRVVPVIDLKDGSVVRAVGGRRHEYRPIRSQIAADAQPITVAKAFVDRGYREAYVADLDAIASSEPAWSIYQTLLACGLDLWVDAGVNNEHRASQLAGFANGSLHVVVGLESIGRRSVADKLFNLIGPERFIFSLDLRDGQPITDEPAWRDKPLAIVDDVLNLGISRLIVLDLANIGNSEGPATISLCQTIRDCHPLVELVSGGGVRNQQDLDSLATAGCNAVLVASALHDGQF